MAKKIDPAVWEILGEGSYERHLETIKQNRKFRRQRIPRAIARKWQTLPSRDKETLAVAAVICVLIGGGAVLTGIAFSILSSIWDAVWGIILEFVHHPITTAKNCFWYVGVAMLIGGSVLCAILLADEPTTNGNAKIIDNFRDKSPYGDADLADRESIQRALQGHNNPAAPQFEE